MTCSDMSEGGRYTAMSAFSPELRRQFRRQGEEIKFKLKRLVSRKMRGRQLTITNFLISDT